MTNDIQLRDECRRQVYGQVSPLIWQETVKMRPGIFKFISDQVSDEVRDQVWDHALGQVYGQVREQLHDIL